MSDDNNINTISTTERSSLDINNTISPDINSLTFQAPVNIAVIKYWGKRNEELILPLNSSLSLTLELNNMCATTTVAVSTSFTHDRLWLNGIEESVDSPRIRKILQEVRRRARKRRRVHPDSISDNYSSRNSRSISGCVHICSENNFPTSAGLASSAAGYACLVTALARLYSIDDCDGVCDDINVITRQGSGSACRSMYGGFVEWTQGEKDDGSDSTCKQLFTETHWPQLWVIVVVVTGKKKCVGSTPGMRRSVQTSDLLKLRTEHIVDKRMTEINKAILNKDFEQFAKITMQESNQLHAVCLDTYPPINYLSSVSHNIMNMVHQYNNHHKSIKLAYTFDAGPNAFLFTLEPSVGEVLTLIEIFFTPIDNKILFVRGLTVPPSQCEEVQLSCDYESVVEKMPGRVEYVIVTRGGCGPRQLTSTNSTLLDSTGLPKSLK